MIPNITLIHGEASKILKERQDIGIIDCAFVGGTKNIRRVLEILHEKEEKRIVVNALRIETVVRTIKTMQELGIFDEAVHISVSSSTSIGGETMFKPDNPVYIISGKSEIQVINEK